MARSDWTREELLKALALYCQIPFGKTHQTNPSVISLAKQIDRTPSAVVFKLGNFASMDPEHQKRGVGGLPHSSRADRDIWAEFYGRWDELASAYSAELGAESPPPDSATPRAFEGPTETLREQSQRRGQAFFRAAVLAAYDGACCITGITSAPLLRASHIVPWSVDESLRVDPRNGICLNALHDAAFDRGLITLSEDWGLRVSSRLKGEVPKRVYDEMFEQHEGKPIRLPERFRPAPLALERHRREVFVA